MPDISFLTVIKNRTKISVNYNNTIYELRLFEKNIRALFDLLYPCDDWEYIIVDYESTDVDMSHFIESLPKKENFKIHLHTLNGVFNKGEGLNYGYKQVSSPVVFFLDADMIIRTREIISDIENFVVKENKVFFPICYSYNEPEHLTGWKRDGGYGNVVQRIETVVPYYPNVRWGREDTLNYNYFLDLDTVIRKFYGDKFVHQWHPEELRNVNYGDQKDCDRVGCKNKKNNKETNKCGTERCLDCINYDSVINTTKVIILYGLRRSGNHFITSTILKQFSSWVHVNDVELSYDEYIKNKAINVTENIVDNRYTGFRGADCLLISIENKLIDQTELDKFKGENNVFSLLLLRNPYNNISSVWEVYKKNPGKLIEAGFLWLQYANIYLNDKLIIKILYDEFATNDEYIKCVFDKMSINLLVLDKEKSLIKWQRSSFKETEKRRKCYGSLENCNFSNDEQFLTLFSNKPDITELWKKILKKEKIPLEKAGLPLPTNKCQREGCPFKKNTDKKNNGGTHCCYMCKKSGGHGTLCTKQKTVD